MSNINGKVYAMNAVTPMKPWKTWILRVIFRALGVFKPAQKDGKPVAMQMQIEVLYQTH